jgi:hypothetical protein
MWEYLQRTLIKPLNKDSSQEVEEMPVGLGFISSIPEATSKIAKDPGAPLNTEADIVADFTPHICIVGDHVGDIAYHF